MTHNRRHYLKTADHRVQEDTLARNHGIKRVVASGAGRDKGDVQGKTFKIECKFTANDSFRLLSRILEKITDEATLVGSLPLMQIQLNTKLKVAVIRWADLNNFLQDSISMTTRRTIKHYEGKNLGSFDITVKGMPSYANEITFNYVVIKTPWVIVAWADFELLMASCNISL